MDPDADPQIHTFREAQKHTDPTDPDPGADSNPEHWYISIIPQRLKSHKEVTKQLKSRLFFYFWLMMIRFEAGSGSTSD